MSTKTEFLSNLVAYDEETTAAIHYSENLQKIVTMPHNLRLEIENETNHCKSLRKKYRAILNSNMFDENYEDAVKKTMDSFEKDSDFLYDFIHKLDMILMVYGKGPPFQKHRILQRQSFEV